MYLLLLTENSSGRTLTIDDVHNSLSINGFMTDYFFSREELKNGQSAALVIQLREDSLKSNRIFSTSDVKEVEIGFEIKEDRNSIDKPMIKISFE